MLLRLGTFSAVGNFIYSFWFCPVNCYLHETTHCFLATHQFLYYSSVLTCPSPSAQSSWPCWNLISAFMSFMCDAGSTFTTAETGSVSIYLTGLCLTSQTKSILRLTFLLQPAVTREPRFTPTCLSALPGLLPGLFLRLRLWSIPKTVMYCGCY